MNLSNRQRKILEEKTLFQSDVDLNKIEDKFQEALLNKYVDHYSKGRLIYTREFYQDLYKLIHDKKFTYVKAYQKLGFNVKELGEDRANAAGKRAVQMAEDGTLYKAQLGDYPGTVPFKDMHYLKNEGDDKYIAYLEGRVLYLESAIDVVTEEKKRSRSEMKNTRQKKTRKVRQRQG